MAFNKNSVSDMKTYLAYAIEFEKYVYLWENSMNKANDEIRQLNNEKRRLYAQKTNSATASSTVITRTQHIANDYDKEAQAIKKRISLCNAVFVVILCLLILPVILMCLNGTTSPFIAITAVIVCALPFTPIYLIIRNRYKNKYNETMANKSKHTSAQHIEYEKKMNNLDYQSAENKLMIISQKEPILTNQAMEISKNLREAKTTLNNIYSLNIIPVKYRNLVAVATLYEYLATGRCTTIQGHGGIYDTYEYELQNKIIISNLQNINATLSRIESNQQFLYSELQQTNRTLSAINSSLVSIEKTNQEIAKNTAISAEANKQTAAAARYLAWNSWANGY